LANQWVGCGHKSQSQGKNGVLHVMHCSFSLKK
jgi:hypothetical protein